MAPEGQKPSQWLSLTQLPREMYSQVIASKALSWGAIRKSACILAEITIRKSQQHSLEGAEGFAEKNLKSGAGKAEAQNPNGCSRRVVFAQEPYLFQKV
jgi:hypothetical protein